MGKTNFRNEINQLRQKHKITISQLAKLAELDYGTVWKFLGGDKQRTNMRSDKLEKLFNVFDKIQRTKPKEKFPIENYYT